MILGSGPRRANGYSDFDAESHTTQLAPSAEAATFFVRALYDYQSTDSSSLSFRKGALIEVLTQLDSGWWDGLLDEERGWFPSNYVVPVPEHEVEQEFQARPVAQQPVEDQVLATTPRAANMPRDVPRHWSPSQRSRSSIIPESTTGSSALPRSISTQSTDYWEPRMTPGGQIFYVNPATGEQSMELPAMGNDADDDAFSEPLYNSVKDGRPAHVRQPSLPVHDARLSHNFATGFDLPRRTVTPEPWIKRITDDGMAYYYYNPVDNQVRWTPPSPPPRASEALSHGAASYGGLGYTRSPLDYAVQMGDMSRSMTQLSTYSDPSELDGHGHNIPARPSAPSNTSTQSVNSRTRRNRAIRRLPDAPLTGPQKAMDHATELQQILAPEEVHSLEAYTIHAREAIEIVIDTATEVMDESPTFPRDAIDFIRERRIAGVSEEDTAPHPQLSGRVAQAVLAVLSLLVVSGKLVPPMLNSDISSDTATQDYIKSVSADPLTSFHRKVSATLSKLVLSARAADAMPDARPPDMAVSVERDAQELERAVVTFVVEVEKAGDAARQRRMKGALSPGQGAAGIGTGIMGGGCGAAWKGNGFVALSADTSAADSLKPIHANVIKDLNHLSMALDENLTRLAEIIGLGYSRLYQSRPGSPTDQYLEQGDPVSAAEDAFHGIPPDIAVQVTEQSRVAITCLSAFGELAENVDIASQVDFDGSVSDVYAPSRLQTLPDEYDSDVRRARVLMRTLEMAKQALYDQGAVLLMASQAAPIEALSGSSNSSEQSPCHIVLTSVSTLKSSVNELMEAFESLLDIAASQATAVRRGHHGRIGLRSPAYRDMTESNILASLSDSFTLADDIPYPDMLDLKDGDPELDLAEALHPFGFSGLDHIYDPNAIFQPGDPSQVRPDAEDEDTPASGSGGSAEAYASGSSPPSPDVPVVHDRANEGLDDNAWNSSLTDDEEEFGAVRQPKHGGKTRGEKLREMLGKEAPAHIIDAQNAELQPSYMKPIYGPPDIIVNPDGGVRGGTLPALIEHLTMHDRLDSTYNDTFLMTFKSFASLDDIVTELIARFNLKQPPNLTTAQFEEWTQSKQKPSRFRTMNVLKSLIQSQTLEQDDLHILDRIKEFATSITQPDMMAPKSQLLQSIKMRTDDAQAKVYKPNGLQFPPQPILPKSLKKFKLLDLDPVELARQLTIMESRLFNKVRPTECLARGKDKPSASLAEDNIKGIITMSNQLAAWVTDSVLAREDPKKRSLVLKHFISAAEHCKRLKNFSSMSALTAGLNGPPLRRLRRSWEQVPQKHVATLADLEQTIDSGKNFTAYRKMLENIDPPCVPFFGIYLTYLTYIQDGNSNFIQVGDSQVINFDKRQKAAQIIREIQRYQAATYDLSPVPAIIDFVEQNMAASTMKESGFWDLSLEREPREREEEKMARLLQESGFL